MVMRYPVMGWAGGFGWLIGLLFLIGLILVIVWLVNVLTGRTTRWTGTPPRDPGRPTANDILRERFARGEITEEQFEQAKKVLGPDQNR